LWCVHAPGTVEIAEKEKTPGTAKSWRESDLGARKKSCNPLSLRTETSTYGTCSLRETRQNEKEVNRGTQG